MEIYLATNNISLYIQYIFFVIRKIIDVCIDDFHRIRIQILIVVLFLFQIMKNEEKRTKVEYFNLSLKSNSRFHVYFVYLVKIINSTNKQTTWNTSTNNMFKHREKWFDFSTLDCRQSQLPFRKVLSSSLVHRYPDYLHHLYRI